MPVDLAFTPSGHLTVVTSTNDVDRRADELAKRFAADPAEGLFALIAERPGPDVSPSVTFWRDFGQRYLTELCHTPETTSARLDEISPPDADELATLTASLPPMPGAEYVTVDALTNVWRELDAWARHQINRSKDGLAGFLGKWAPLWHQVGRVCFHLAENRHNELFPFAFLATYAQNVNRSARIQYQPLSQALKEYAGAKNRKALLKLLTPIHAAAEASPLVQGLVDSGDIYQPLAWTPIEAHRFLKEVPVFEKSGVLVRLPDWWKKRPRPRVGVEIGGKKKGSFDADAMLDFNVHLALGNEKLTTKEWQALLAGDEGLVLLRGQWVEVDHNKLNEALDHWKQVEKEAPDGISFIKGMRMLAGASAELSGDDELDAETADWAFVTAGNWLGKLLADQRNPENLAQAKLDGPLGKTLRPYQQTGVNWLSFMTQLGLGACLADDMGLGKTIQVLALLSLLKKKRGSRPSLLVLPASLVANWKAEMARFTPGLRGAFVHASEVSREQLVKMADNPTAALKGVDVVLTTYGMVLRQAWLAEIDWQLVVLDEAQAIKNPSARQTKAVKRLKAASRIALTGTPVENRLGDLWSLFDFLCPGLLGSAKRFKDFVKVLDKRETNRYAPLRGLVQPYILRRMKTDRRIITDLPEKTEMRAFCGLSRRQATLYARLVDEMTEALETLDGIQRRGLVLAYLMRFKQLCNHPSQLTGDGKYGATESGKLARLGEICDEIASRQEKALVFTQFREMTEPLSNFLASIFGRAGLVLHGGTAVKSRKKLVDRFQQEDGPPFFVLSLKAGGTGLNLTAASHVIHFDRWWNPAVENQATDRAFRIGQKRNVLVHKFVCRGTIEEKIDGLIEEKTDLANQLLSGGAEKMLTEMTDAELIDLVSLDVEKTRV